MAYPSSSHREESPPAPEQATRDWAELPRDALLTVLQKLGHVDILMGVAQVCGPWARAAREEPELWRRVDLRLHGRRLMPPRRANSMAREAVRRGAGQCQAFWAEGALDHSVISLLGDTSALSLKSLRLIYCDWIYDTPLALTMTKFTLLEELELSNYRADFPKTCTAAGKACPLLKRLRLSSERFVKHSQVPADGEAAAIATTMPGLRSLQLFAKRLTNGGLAAILDGCPLLESLDIRHCFNIVMNDELCARCSLVEMLRHPHDPTDDYDLKFSSPDMDYPWVRMTPQTEYYDEWEFSSR
ncbi:putative F-box/LRR-repeat protein 23 [Lolium rigidum]|uniref:putative F-box/LRR-repeat protein 23 n=1 Tax=Lolium rigidum TaxID=89674 RepID=UPI001F5DC00F|nr:putative F-box/LRR-repeat protein 23 [Lolium rigidum]